MTTLPQTAPIRAPRALPSGQLSAGVTPFGMAQAPVQSTMNAADIWRVIRANSWLIIIVLVASIAAGYGLNSWLAANHSKYVSTGLIRVQLMNEKYNGITEHVGGVNPAELEVEQNTQVRLITHERLLSAILSSPGPIRETTWFKQFTFVKDGQQQVDAEAAKADLLDHLSVNAVGSSRLIQVQMQSKVPKDCQTIVTEIIEQHISNQQKQSNNADVERSNSLEQLKLNYEGQIREISGLRARIALDLGNMGVGIGPGASSKEWELQQLISEQLRAEAVLSGATAKLATFDKQMETNSAPELEEAVQRSPLYNDYHRAVDEFELAYGEEVSRSGPDHPRSLGYKRRLDATRLKLSDTENDIKGRTAELIRANLLNDAAAAESALKRIVRRIGDLKHEIADLAKQRNDYERLGSELATIRSNLDRVKDEQDKIGFLMGDHMKWSQVTWATLPDLPDHTIFPKLWQTLPAVVIVGLALSLGIAFMRELTDTTVRTPRDIARVGHLTLLGMIPHEADDPQAAGARLPLAIFEAPHSIIAEQFRQVRTRLQHATSLDTTRSILVTGCSPGDGKTTVAVNLAAGLALNGRRILLVDANFRRPALHNIFNTPGDLGFGDVLNNIDMFDEAVHETEVPNLSVIAAGARPSNPTELLESQLLIDFIERTLEEYDHVIFDSGPLLMVSDSIALAPRVDGVVTVVRARGNSRGMLTRMRDELRRLKAEHLGVVLNAVRVYGGGYFGPMIKNYYAYQNAE